MSRTACTLPACVRKEITKFLTSNFFSIFLILRTTQGRVERIAQTVTKQVKTQHQQANEKRGEQHHIRITGKIFLRAGEHVTNGSHATRLQVDNT